jgi:hypothetical protein
MLSIAAMSAAATAAKAVEECRIEPGLAAPAGAKWISRINRYHQHCWFLSSSSDHHTQPRSFAPVKHPHGVDNAAVSQKSQAGQPEFASALAAKRNDNPTSLVSSTGPPAAASPEEFVKEAKPRSVQTIAYRVEGANPPIGLVPVVPYAVETRPASEVRTLPPNTIVLGGCALGCLGAGSILWFAGRNPTSARRRVYLERRFDAAVRE